MSKRLGGGRTKHYDKVTSTWTEENLGHHVELTKLCQALIAQVCAGQSYPACSMSICCLHKQLLYQSYIFNPLYCSH